MQIRTLLTEQRIKMPMAATSKDELIAELLDVLAANGDLANRDAALQAVLDREATRSTGIGGGFAVPHAKTDAVDRLVMALGKPATPVDFQSADGKPVTLVVLMLSPLDQTGPHIQALAKISRLMMINGFRRKLDAAQNAQQVMAAVEEYEETGA